MHVMNVACTHDLRAYPPTRLEVSMAGSLWTVEQVAQRLGVRPSTVRAGVTAGQIPAVVLWKGKRRSLVRFRPEDIEQFIQERTTTESQVNGQTPPSCESGTGSFDDHSR